MASDGKVVISTELDNSSIEKDAKEMNRSLKSQVMKLAHEYKKQGMAMSAAMKKAYAEIGAAGKQSTQYVSTGVGEISGLLGGLGNVVKKLGGVIAAAFSVKAIVAFAQECLELGSDLQEVQNVVDVTFTTMNEQVNEFAKNAAQTAGLSETMAKKYTGTFGAMAKSFKFTEAEAYEMSTALTQLSGDVASFYNLSQDEAYTKLKSVFTGETESLKDLGVVMTQTALDSYALANGFGKTTSQMTEQEKVALRYRFVMDQLSAASGDFARTSDSWANQTRLLTLQFEQLKATLGQGLINVLTPAVKLLNTLLVQLQGVADAFLSFSNALFGDAGGSSAQTAEDIADGYASAADSAESLAESTKETKRALAGFDELNVLNGGAADTATSSLLTGVSAGDISVGGNVQDDISPEIQRVVDKIMALIEPLRNIDLGPAMDSFGNLGASISSFGAIVFDALEWAWFNVLVPLSEWTIEDFAPELVNTLASAFDSLAVALEPVQDGLKELHEESEPIFTWIGDTVLWVLQQFRSLFAKVAQVFEEKGPQIQKIFSGIGEIISLVWSVLQPILNDLQKQFGFVFDFLGNLISGWIGDFIDGFAGIVDFFAGVFTGDWKRAMNGVIGVLNSMISSVFSGLNSMIKALNNISFDIPEWVPALGGKKFGINLPTLKVPQIPELAQGAVIPPNREFMAILGDQRHGTNIEAPLSTIQEAVALVMEDMTGGMMAGFEATVAVLKEILQAVYGIEIGDDVIGQAVARYNSKMAVARGG